MAVGVLVLIIGALVPVAIGVVLIVLSRRGGVPYPSCGGCGYDVSGTVGTAARCPECGSAFTEVGIIPAGSGPRRWLLLSGVALVLIVVTCVGGSLTVSLVVAAQAQAARRAAEAARMQAVVDAEAARAAQQEAERIEVEPDR